MRFGDPPGAVPAGIGGVSLGVLTWVLDQIGVRLNPPLATSLVFLTVVGIVYGLYGFLYDMWLKPPSDDDSSRSIPQFSIDAPSFGSRAKRGSPEFHDKEWVPEDAAIFEGDEFRVTNKARVPLELFLYLIIPRCGPNPLSGSLVENPQYRLGEDSGFPGSNHYITSPIRIPPNESIKGTLLFVDWMGSNRHRRDGDPPYILQMRHHPSDSIWEIPLPARNLSGSDLDEYLQEPTIS